MLAHWAWLGDSPRRRRNPTLCSITEVTALTRTSASRISSLLACVCTRYKAPASADQAAAPTQTKGNQKAASSDGEPSSSSGQHKDSESSDRLIRAACRAQGA